MKEKVCLFTFSPRRGNAIDGKKAATGSGMIGVKGKSLFGVEYEILLSGVVMGNGRSGRAYVGSSRVVGKLVRTGTPQLPSVGFKG